MSLIENTLEGQINKVDIAIKRLKAYNQLLRNPLHGVLRRLQQPRQKHKDGRSRRRSMEQEGRHMNYIDRDALGIGYADRSLFNDPAYADGWNSAIKLLKDAPSADVAPIRHGEWILDEAETGVEAFGFKERTVTGYICSICGASIDVSNGCFCYCPNCGAKMDLEAKENDT